MQFLGWHAVTSFLWLVTLRTLGGLWHCSRPNPLSTAFQPPHNSLIASVRQLAPGVQFCSSSSRARRAECDFDLQFTLDAVWHRANQVCSDGVWVKYKFIKTTFIENQFHQKTTFIKKPLSPKTSFIKDHFHQKPISSETTSCQIVSTHSQHGPSLCGRRCFT